MVIDGSNAALDAMNVQLWLAGYFMLCLIEIFSIKYLNNIVEQSHRWVKQKTRQLWDGNRSNSWSRSVDHVKTGTDWCWWRLCLREVLRSRRISVSRGHCLHVKNGVFSINTLLNTFSRCVVAFCGIRACIFIKNDRGWGDRWLRIDEVLRSVLGATKILSLSLIYR